MGVLTKWSTSFGSNDLWGSNKVYYFQDVNGDNLVDMVAFQKDGVFVAINQKSSFRSKSLWNTQLTNGQIFNNRFLVDLNVDGLVDLIGVSANKLVVAINNGTGFGKTQYYNGYTNGYTKVIDVNKDFLPDIVRVYSKKIFVSLNNGTGFNKETTYGILSTSNSPVYFLDINKDDYIDIAWIDIVTNKILVSFNNKTGFESTINEITKFTNLNKYSFDNFEFVDLFSNNTLSILALSSCGVLVSTDLKNNQALSLVKNSFDESNIINYNYLSNVSIYESTKLTSYSYMSKYFSKRVVSSIEVPSGIKNTQNITYFNNFRFI